MRIIIIMLVFELSDHTALKSVIISDNPSSYPMYHGAAWLLRLCDSCYFQSLLSSLVPCALQTQPHLAPPHQQVIVIMNSKIIGLIRAGFMLCFERGTVRYTIAPTWNDSLNLSSHTHTHAHKFFSACYYVQTVPTQIIRGAFSCIYIYLFLRLILLKIDNFCERY